MCDDIHKYHYIFMQYTGSLIPQGKEKFSIWKCIRRQTFLMHHLECWRLWLPYSYSKTAGNDVS